MKRRRLVWLIPETHGGVHAHSAALWPHVHRQLSVDARFRGWEFLDPVVADLRSRTAVVAIADRVRKLRPALVHVQHEFSLFGGSKLPTRYHFPALVRDLRQGDPAPRIVATAHTVLDARSRYTYGGRGVENVLRFGLNATVVPLARRNWTRGTWGILDAVIVHSELQVDAIQDSGCPHVDVIPLAVFTHPGDSTREPASSPATIGMPGSVPEVVVVGYLSPAKGQDIAIEALSYFDARQRPQLVLAGGVRRKEDEGFATRCRTIARHLGVSESVTVTGFVPETELPALLDRATVVLAPFRETSGSASIAQALGRGCVILASDLPLDRELAQRVPGCIELFETGNPRACAERLGTLLTDAQKRAALRAGAQRYAEHFGPESIARLHLELYASVARVPGV